MTRGELPPGAGPAHRSGSVDAMGLPPPHPDSDALRAAFAAAGGRLSEGFTWGHPRLVLLSWLVLCVGSSICMVPPVGPCMCQEALPGHNPATCFLFPTFQAGAASGRRAAAEPRVR